MRDVVRAVAAAWMVAALGCGGSGGSSSDDGGGSDPSGRRVSFSGPEETVGTSDGNILIHFTREGVDAVDDAFVALGSEALEMAWAELTGPLGWSTPPGDGAEGGDERYDVYLNSFASRGDTTTRGRALPTQPEGASFVLVNTDIRSGADPSRHPLNVLYSERFVKSVFAHELVHGMQFAAHARFGDAPRTFFSENSATYHGADFFGLFESTAPKDAAVLAYLLALVLREPGTSLHADTNGREYVPIWSKYLVDSRGGDRTILRRIYEELDRDPQGGLFGATDRVLRASGGSLEEDYQQYAEWNYKVGPYADGSGYPEAARFETNWGSVNVQAGHGAPPIEASSSLRGLPSLASYYIRFRPGPTTTDGVFRLGGLPGFRWGVSVLARDAETGVYAVVRDRSGPLNGKIDLVLRDWNAADDLVAIVSNLTVRDQPGDAAGLFSYRIEALPAD